MSLILKLKLTRESIQLITSGRARILLIIRVHTLDKNSKRIRAIRPFVFSYDDFTEFPVLLQYITRKTESKNFNLKFCTKIDFLVPKDIGCSKQIRFS